MAKTIPIKLNDLLINTENYRYDPLTSQREAIDKLVDDQGDSLFNLAESILLYGLSPIDGIQVFPSAHDPSKYIVLEGNRRIVCLKILHNPDLIEGVQHASIKKKIKNLVEKHKITPLSKVECLVYDDPQEADLWIGIKHGYGKAGVGTAGWNPLQKQRYGEKTEGKPSTSMQIIKFLQNSNTVPEEIRKNADKINVTNLERLIDDPDVREFLGIDISKGIVESIIDEKEVLKGLTQVFKDVLDKKFRVKKIYDKTARKDYTKEFPKASRPNVHLKKQSSWQLNNTVVTTEETNPTKSKPKLNPKDRNRLIPKSCSLKINNPKVNTIFHELRDIDINKFTNAAAVLFRVFVELSIDSYLEKHTLAGATSASKSNMNFQQKINIAADHLQTKNHTDSAICKGIKAAIKNPNDLLGIDTWHAYVHNNKFSPIPKNLITTWDNMQEFMTILWNNIN
jgi:hypothetical protein